MKVYIAGPYTNGDPVLNIQRVIRAAELVRHYGHLPFVPHLSHLWHLCSPHDYEYWMEMCLEWVAECDCLIRLPGESEGADREYLRAKALGIPTYWRKDMDLTLTEWVNDAPQ